MICKLKSLQVEEIRFLLPAMTILSAEQVSKHYGDVKALDQISFKLDAGESLCLLGPNGSGKSTCIGLLLGLRQPTFGQLSLFGKSPRLKEVRKRLGASLQEVNFPSSLKSSEILKFVLSHYPKGIDVHKLKKAFGLDEFWNRQTGALSGGQRRRLSLACAFAGQPDLVFLDEPTTGMDVESRQMMWEYCDAYVKNGGSLVFSTHYLAEAESYASRVLVLFQGQKIFDGTVSEIKSEVEFKELSFDWPSAWQMQSPLILNTDRQAERIVLTCQDADQLIRQLVNNEVDFKNLELSRVSLEKAFVLLLEKQEHNEQSKVLREDQNANLSAH